MEPSTGRRLWLALASSVGAAVFLPGCVETIAITVQGGSLEINPRLRADLGASQGMDNGRFFADGECVGSGSSGNPQLRECHFITPILGSMVDALDDDFLTRLRRAEFLWVEAEGFPLLSYELIGRNVTVRDVDENTNILSGADIGTCYGFPLLNPETRAPVPGLGPISIARGDEYIHQFDVTVHECAAAVNEPVSESLAPQTGNCSDTSILSILGANRPGPPQVWPLCLLNVPFSSFTNDASYSLLPSAPPGADLQILWPGLQPQLLQALPHVKTVPVDGTRTISRSLVATGEKQEHGDGTTTHHFEWKVGVTSDGWTENFSPNIVVKKARVRRGALSNANRAFVPVVALEVGGQDCQVRDETAGYTVFDLPMCDLAQHANFRVTPAYRQSLLELGPVDDDLRLAWQPRLRLPRSALDSSDQYFLELDLTAITPTGTSGAGLMADPGGMDLGNVRTGPGSSPRHVFTLRNFGPVSAWVESVTLAGLNAIEFGATQIHRTPAPGTASSTPPPAAVTTPFIFRAGSTAEVSVVPAFQFVGEKRADVVVTFRDVVAGAHSIRAGLVAQAVSPALSVLPTTVYFVAQPGAIGHATARSAALLANDGPIAFQRLALSITGPHASEFRVLSGEYGPTASDLAQPLTLGPGESEIYRLGFYPTTTSVRNATLLINTTEGQMRVSLQGVCTASCTQPPQLTLDEVGPGPVAVTRQPRVKLKLKRYRSPPLEAKPRT